MSIVLGIDTGGTYTDGVVFDLNNQEIIAKSKALTTYNDLTIGINNCIKKLQFDNYKKIHGVSLSTTLATNSIVENRGCKVGIIMIGHEPIGKMPTKYYKVIKGGYNVKGQLIERIDLSEARRAIYSFKNKVDAIAISGYFSIRNPEQEIKIRDIINEELDIPVVCAHNLTTSLGFHERTVTAALNARLLPIIANLIQSIKKVLNSYKIHCPLMIVKGDGSLMSEDMVRNKPIDTILSGPAASIIGSTHLTKLDNALVLDMGGTTTDIAILEKGRPRINPEGALVGGWHTRVQAAEIYTYGIGGDSYIKIDRGGKLKIGPNKVLPLSVVCKDNPHIINELTEQGKKNRISNLFNPTDCFILKTKDIPNNLSERETEIVNILRDKPHSVLYISRKMKEKMYPLHLRKLLQLDIIQRVSITPTDILHVKGSYTCWSIEGARAGISILAKKLGKSVNEFIEIAMEAIGDKLCKTIIQSLINYEGQNIDINKDVVADYFVSKALRSNNRDVLMSFIKSKYPIVAMGAPVSAYLPKVADKINTELIIPEHAEVANAVGAATGKIIKKVETLIRRSLGEGYILHSPWGRKVFKELEDAKEYTLEESKKYILSEAEKHYTCDYQIIKNQKDSYVQSEEKAGKTYIETITELRVVGRPKW